MRLNAASTSRSLKAAGRNPCHTLSGSGHPSRSSVSRSVRYTLLASPHVRDAGRDRPPIQLAGLAPHQQFDVVERAHRIDVDVLVGHVCAQVDQQVLGREHAHVDLAHPGRHRSFPQLLPAQAVLESRVQQRPVDLQRRRPSFHERRDVVVIAHLQVQVERPRGPVTRPLDYLQRPADVPQGNQQVDVPGWPFADAFVQVGGQVHALHRHEIHILLLEGAGQHVELPQHVQVSGRVGLQDPAQLHAYVWRQRYLESLRAPKQQRSHAQRLGRLDHLTPLPIIQGRNAPHRLGGRVILQERENMLLALIHGLRAFCARGGAKIIT